MPPEKADAPEIIELPVILNCKPARNPVIINQSPTLVALVNDYLEISMHYEYECDEMSADDYDKEEAWKKLADENAPTREKKKIYHHVVILKKTIRAINMQYDILDENWYIEFDAPCCPLLHIEFDRGRELFMQLICWWKKKNKGLLKK